MVLSWEFVVTALLLTFVIMKRSVLKFYWKFFITYAWVIGLSPFYLPLFLLRPKNVENLLMALGPMGLTANFAGLKYTLRGSEHLSKDQTCVIIVNHQSSVDLVGMFKIWSVIRRATIVAKREILFIGTFGLLMYLAGLTFINRKAGGKAGEALNEIVEKLKKKRIKLWVFAEGTRRNTGVIHQFKKGGFHAAIHAQVPIVPVVFSSYKSFLNVEEKIFNSGSVIIEALPEISTQGMRPEDVEKLMEMTRNAMIQKYEELNSEIEKQEN